MFAAIVPDLTQLAVVAATAFIALLTAGLGVWCGARRAETALLAGWGLAGFTTVVAGTLSPIGLTPVLAVLGLAGLGGLGQALRRRGRLDAAMAARVLVLSLPLFFCTANMRTMAWDDYSHWLPNLAYLCAHDNFPSLALPGGSEHAAYPYGLALPGLSVYRLFHLAPENVALIWNQIMILAAGASIAGILQRRAPASAPWAFAVMGWLLAGLAGPAFVAKIVFSNMADSSTGAVMAVLLSLLWDWVATGGDTRRRAPLALVFALGCIALLNLRQANGAPYGLLILGSLIAGWRQRSDMRAGGGLALGVAVGLPVADALLWNHYTETRIPGGQFAILPPDRWRWDMVGHIAGSMLHVMVSKTGLFLLILVLAVRAVLALRRTDRLDPPRRAVTIAGAFTAIGMIGFLGFTYLAASFSDQESVSAASFWRYMGEMGPMTVLAAAALVPLGFTARLPHRAATFVLVAATLAAPFVALRAYRDDLTSPVPSLIRIGLAVARTVPPTAPLLLLDMTSNGFPLLIVNYELSLSPSAQQRPPRPIHLDYSIDGLPPGAVSRKDLAAASFVFLAEGGAGTEALFGTPLGSNCSYLLKQDDAVFTVLTRWPIGRHRWFVVGSGGPVTEDPACR